jgi:hypothetical protein
VLAGAGGGPVIVAEQVIDSVHEQPITAMEATMATKVTVVLEDDLDGWPLTENITLDSAQRLKTSARRPAG